MLASWLTSRVPPLSDKVPSLIVSAAFTFSVPERVNLSAKLKVPPPAPGNSIDLPAGISKALFNVSVFVSAISIREDPECDNVSIIES